MIEKITEYFDKRVDTYDQHQLDTIPRAKEFYPFTSNQLPKNKKVKILDLGCGTGLELDYYDNEQAEIVAIDCSKKMLAKAKEKLVNKKINFIVDDIFKHNYGSNLYDVIISVQVLHHYNKAQKTLLFMKLFESLKPNGYFILTDFFAKDMIQEANFKNKATELLNKENVDKTQTYNVDTPFTIEHEISCLQQAGFTVEVLKTWEQTSCIKCMKK